MSSRRPAPIPALTILVLTLLAAALVLIPGSGTKTVTAEFDRTVGLFEGSDVRVMGMRIGKVARITPHGTAVRVEMTYDDQYKLPAGVQAVVVAPSVIADRFVQLTPGWVEGEVLASGAVIPESDTRVPVELDTSIEVTTDLMTALGPQGANKDGALSAALRTIAGLMEGNGADTRAALHDLAAASDVLGAGADDLSGTVEHLSGLTGTLATYDADVRRFNEQLGSVASALGEDSTELSRLLATLASSLGEVASFVADNRRALQTDVRRLAGVTGALVAERKALIEIADIAPLAFTNLTETYDPQAQAVRTRANFTEISRVLDRIICDTLSKQAGPAIAPLCAALRSALDGLPIRDGLGRPVAPQGRPVAVRQPVSNGTLADNLAGLGGFLNGSLEGFR